MESKIPTSEGDKTIPEIMDHLQWCSYKSHRDRGETSDALLIKHGIGTPAMAKRYEKEKLRDKIISNLKELDPEKSIMADAIYHAVNNHYNFENVVNLIISAATDNPDGMIQVIGNETLGLVLKYSKL